ncbi:MAG TPA: hypothetical protein VFJ68_03285 [Casimicrobiaceae bacterium]|nr:hypothetical protein [Casimicrobiaceae bacterium]
MTTMLALVAEAIVAAATPTRAESLAIAGLKLLPETDTVVPATATDGVKLAIVGGA